MTRPAGKKNKKKGPPGSISAGFIALLGALVLLAAIAVDYGLIRKQAREIRELTARYEVLQQQLASARGALDPRETALSDSMLKLALSDRSDPVRYLGDALSDAGLERLDLNARENRQGVAGGFRKQYFSLRALGSFPRIQRFVRSIEEGPKLVAIDAMTIKPAAESSLLEARFEVQVIEPLMGRH